MIYSDLKISPLKNHRFIVLEDFKYKDIVVPKGFTSDGASIPRIFWSFYPPNRTDYLPAAILHDYLYPINKQLANCLFENILFDLNISKFDIFILVYGVRLYSLIRYNIPMTSYQHFKEKYF